MFIVKNLQIPLGLQIDIREALLRKLRCNLSSSIQIWILRKAIDARKKNNLKLTYTLLVEGLPKMDHPDILPYKAPEPYINEQHKLNNSEPFIIGAGPAGLFAALGLVDKGFKPIIFDRGEDLEARTIKVNDFWRNGNLNEESNVQFGEGGAGTFSDGKLTSRNRDFYSNKIFDYLIKFGAGEDIKYEALPHLGTDKLRTIIKNIREFLIEKGCSFHWKHKLSQIQLKNRSIVNVTINGQKFKPEILILAVGNSARDTFEMLNEIGAVENKPFAIGVRIEHSQDFVNRAFYGDKTDISLTGPATYRLTAKHGKKGVYSFCMCPGGYVIAASSEKEHLTINGMSFSDRSHNLANSAIVVSVDNSDFGNDNLAGIEYQRKIERASFSHTQKYFAPMQSARDFIKGQVSSKKLSYSYRPGVNSIDINRLFPENIVSSLQFGLTQFEKKIPGFVQDGILLAPETRTSSPIRVLRHRNTYNSLVAENLYPVGEGSGYAGGIISSAGDGYKISQIFYR